MSTTIICPNCKTQFEPNEAMEQSIRAQIAKEFNQKWVEEQRKKDEQYKERERLVQQEIAQKMQGDFTAQLQLLQQQNKDNEDRLKEARAKEMDYLKEMQALKSKEQELEIAMQRRMLEERTRLGEQMRKEEEEKNRLRDTEYQMKVKELEKQLDDQRKLAEEMRRKAEQGSMQLQGEVQELALEELLRFAFPFDEVSEVGKGVRGADCIQTVRNNFGQECGKIIYESKRTKEFSQEWIEKLKADMRGLGADVGVLVTQAMPKGMDCFGEKDGIWICSFDEVKALTYVLRELIVKVYNTAKSQENKGDKMTMLYNYLTSHEFSAQWRAIREGFMTMKISIQRERDQMEKLWKAREKQLEKVLLNAAHIKGSIEGISGMDVDLSLIEDIDTPLLD